MLRMIMSGNYQFGSPEWDDYSDTVKDLVRRQACWLPSSGKGKSPLWGGHRMEASARKDPMSSEVLEGTLLCCFQSTSLVVSGFPLLGGEPPGPLFSRRGLSTSLLPAVCCGRSASLQPPGEVQGKMFPSYLWPWGSCCCLLKSKSSETCPQGLLLTPPGFPGYLLSSPNPP